MSKLLVIDTETGGLDPEKHSLLSVGMVVLENLEVVDTLETYIAREGYYVTPAAMQVNNIDFSVLEQGNRPLAALLLIKTFILQHFTSAPAPILGHNPQFDIAYLKRFFNTEAPNTYPDYNALFSHRVTDTCSIGRFLIDAGLIELESGSSDALFKHFGIEAQGRHTALGDALATAELYKAMIALIKGNAA